MGAVKEKYLNNVSFRERFDTYDEWPDEYLTDESKQEIAHNEENK